MTSGFSVEVVPDGAILAPHYLCVGALIVLLAALPTVDDRPARETMPTLTGALVGSLAFLTVWPFYPVVGAVLTICATVVCLLAPVRPPF